MSPAFGRKGGAIDSVATAQASNGKYIAPRVVILPSTTIFQLISQVTVNAATETVAGKSTTITVMASTTNVAFATVTAASPALSPVVDSACGEYTNTELTGGQTINLACPSSVACSRSKIQDSVYVYCPAPSAITSMLNPTSVTNLGDCWNHGIGCCYPGEKPGYAFSGKTSMWICVPNAQTQTAMPGIFNKALRSPSSSVTSTTDAITTATGDTSLTPTSSDLLVVPLSPTSAPTTSPTPPQPLSAGDKYPPALVIGVGVGGSVGAILIIFLAICLFIRWRKIQPPPTPPQKGHKRCSSFNASTIPILTGDGRRKIAFDTESRTKYEIRHQVPLTSTPIWSAERKASLTDVHELAEFGSTPTKSKMPGFPPTENHKHVLARLSEKHKKIFLAFGEDDRDLITRMSTPQRKLFMTKSSPQQREALLAVRSIGNERPLPQGGKAPKLSSKRNESGECIEKASATHDFGVSGVRRMKSQDVPMSGNRSPKRVGSNEDVRRMTTITEKTGE